MKKVLLGFLCVLITASGVWAQSQTVSGRVTSADEPEGIPGVSVSVKGTTVGTVTDLDGSYTVSIPENASVLVFSFVGFRTQEVPVGNKNEIDVVLEADVRILSEVVVTAQNIERNEKSLGYNVQSVKGDVISQRSEPISLTPCKEGWPG